MGKIMVFANQKGGVGKTTTAVNLGAYLAELGRKVLLVDFDPQGNASSCLGAPAEGRGIYEVISGKMDIRQAVRKTEVANLFIVPSDQDLAGATVELIGLDEKEYVLKKALAEVRLEYDYIFIDCPPSLGILTVNGLVAAESVIIPLQCEYFALEGLSLLMKTIGRIQQGYNGGLQVGGILFTMYDIRTRLAHEVVQEVTSFFKEKVFRTIIPRNVRLSEAPSYSQPISLYDPECIGAKSYRSLAEEVLSHV